MKIGQAKFDEEIEVLEELVHNENLEGIFQAETEIFKDREDKYKVPSLPSAYQKTVGINGCKLSQDQKHRLAIARAVVFKPKIVIIDDITQGLEDEPELEAKVDKAIHNAMEATTSIYFTDRASYASTMGKEIIVIEDGKVAQQGKFEELKGQNGCLSKLIINE